MTTQPLYLGDVSSLNIYNITNLYLYGQTTTPLNVYDRLRSAAAYANLPLVNNVPMLQIQIEMSSYMNQSTGPGRYARASEATIVQDFFNEAGTLASLQDGLYTKAMLTAAPYGYTEEHFKFTLNQHELNSGSADYALRTYVFETGGFKISDDAIFKVENGVRSIENMAVLAFHDNFDFNSDSLASILGNSYLENAIDPYGIGRTLQIQMVNGSQVQRVDYDESDFTADVTFMNNIPGWSAGQLISDMEDLVDDLRQEGTIDYEYGDGLIVYGTAGNDSAENGSVYEDVIVSGDGQDQINGHAGADIIYAGTGNDTLTGGVGNDYLHGGLGTDTAIFSGNLSDYSIIGGTTNVIVTDAVGTDGTDTLVQIERMQFADGIYEHGAFKKSSLQAPVANDDVKIVAVNGSINFNAASNDYDPDKQAMTIALTTQASNGTATLNLNGTFTYVPSTNFSGLDSFTYTLTDDDSLTETATVYIVVGSSGILGGSGSDTLNGTSGNDVIVGLDGNDSLDGNGGADVIYGDTGADLLFGDTGNDQLYGGDGNDQLMGEAGSDVLYGGAGNDTFFGNDGTETYVGGSGSDKFVFDMDVDTGWAGINESDFQGSDVIYLENVTGGDRIEFHYNTGTNQIDAYFYPTSGGAASFSFSFSAANALAGKGVDFIVMDGGMAYTTKNIINAADFEANNIFVFDIATYDAGDYPRLLPESSGPVQPMQQNYGGVSMYAGWGSNNSMTELLYVDPIFHALTYTGGSSPDGASSAPVIGYIKEYHFHSGISTDDVRMTVSSDDNAKLTIYLENLGVEYNIDYFENGYTISGFRMNASGSSSVSNVVGTGHGSWTVEGTDLPFADILTHDTYFFEKLFFSNGDVINLQGILNLEGTANGDTLYGLDRADVINGYDGGDSINAKGGNDLIYGGNGNDDLTGGDGDDTLIGGAGQEYSMYGGAGDDTYEFELGDAYGGLGYHDGVAENTSEGTDTVLFGEGVDEEDVYSWTDSSGGLYVQYSANDFIRISASTQNDANNTYASLVGSYVEQIVFADTTTWDLTAGLHLRNNNTSRGLYGTTFNDTIEGGTAAEDIYGNDGNDLLIGGAGQEYNIYGGNGNDTYQFNLGDAYGGLGYHDGVAEDTSEGTDTVLFGDGIDVEDVYMWTDSSGGLYVQYSANDNIRISASTQNDANNTYASLVGSYVEQIVFADTTTWDLTAGLHLRNNNTSRGLYGTTFNDTIEGGTAAEDIYGNDGNDLLIGGAGQEYNIYGGNGNDTYQFNLGDAYGGLGYHDGVAEDTSEGTDTVLFGAGIDVEDVYMWTDSSGGLYVQYSANDNIRISASTQNDANNTYASLVGSYVEQIVFADTTTWDLTAGLHLRNNNTSRGLYGTTFNDTIEGGTAAEDIYGNDGNDLLIGGAGQEYNIYGGNGNDTYQFNLGDAYGGLGYHDGVAENMSAGTDTVLFGAGIGVEDVYMWTDTSGGLYVKFSADDFIRISASTQNDANNTYASLVGSYVEQIVFADTTTWDLTAGLHIRNDNTSRGLYGTTFNDTIEGGTAAEDIYGNDGNDLLIGGAGQEYNIYGGNGNDTYQFNLGDAYGGLGYHDGVAEDTSEGTDTVLFGDGIDVEDVYMWTDSSGGLYVQYSANDNIRISAASTTANGNMYATLIGSYVEQIVFADATTWDLTGGLHLRNNNTSRALYGTTFNDTIEGGTAAEDIYGNEGDDVIEGGGGDDSVDGGAGNDTLTYTNAGAGITMNLATATGQATGGAGTDTVSNFEHLIGSAFNDTLTGNSSDNTITGGAGNDTIEGAAGNDTLNGGDGTDTLTYKNAGAGITMNLATATGQNTGGAGTDTVSNFENLVGSAFNDTLTGNGSANVIEGGDGNDTINGAGGTDTLTYANAGAGITMNLATATGQNTGGAGTDTVSNFENLVGSGFNDTLTGNGSANVIEGGAGNDTINGAGGTDTLTYANAGAGITMNLATATGQNTGGAGTDTVSNFENLTGSAFNDTLTGNGSANVIEGGDGNDTINGAGGTDTVTYVNAASAVTVSLATGSAQNTGGAGTDTLSNLERLTGSGYNDTLTGSTAVNVIDGGGGNDTLYGGDGADTLTGGDGNDVLYGQVGIDALTGGLGADQYAFQAASAYSAIDTVSDFSTAQGDALNLVNLLTDFDPLTEAITDFVLMATSGANTNVSIDRDGTGATYGFTQIATLTGVTGLTDEAALLANGNLIAA